jgi:dihydroorotase
MSLYYHCTKHENQQSAKGEGERKADTVYTHHLLDCFQHHIWGKRKLPLIFCLPYYMFGP